MPPSGEVRVLGIREFPGARALKPAGCSRRDEEAKLGIAFAVNPRLSTRSVAREVLFEQPIDHVPLRSVDAALQGIMLELELQCGVSANLSRRSVSAAPRARTPCRSE